MESGTSKARSAQDREAAIYCWIAGTWMTCAILFGALNLVGILQFR